MPTTGVTSVVRDLRRAAAIADEQRGQDEPAELRWRSRAPDRPSARSRLLTAIQNGFVRPVTAVRLPFWSHVQPVRPCEIGTCIWCWSVVVG